MMISRSWNERWIREIILEKKHTITKEKNSLLIAGRKKLTRDWIKTVSVFPLHFPYFFFLICHVSFLPFARAELVFSCLDLT